MKTLTLDINKWRCGGDAKEGVRALHARQQTQLLNKTGSMCCLGQFALQLGAKKHKILYKGAPSDIGKYIPILTKRRYNTLNCNTDIINTKFSGYAMEINDDRNTPIAEKVKLLKALCSKYKIKLKVKGKIPKPA